jgi:hypothetical protein
MLVAVVPEVHTQVQVVLKAVVVQAIISQVEEHKLQEEQQELEVTQRMLLKLDLEMVVQEIHNTVVVAGGGYYGGGRRLL